MKLNQSNVLKNLKIVGNPDTEITTVAFDNRKPIPKGSLFFAIPGNTFNGEDYINNAIQKGATAIVLEEKSTVEPTEGIAFIYSPAIRETFALLSQELYPDRPNILTAVTGTNGKTSIVEFTRQFFEMLHTAAASLGTMGIQSKSFSKDGNLTSPDPLTFYQTLAKLSDKKVKALCFEASSIGLDQDRIKGLDGQINAVGLTNLTEDHLDYHGSMEKYFEAKSKLFTQYLSPEGIAVINADDSYGQALISQLESPLTYGKKATHFKIIKRIPTASGQLVSLEILGQPLEISFPLMGDFQLYNALSGLGLAFGGLHGKKARETVFWKEHLEQVKTMLENLKPIRGRLEYVKKTETGATVFIDYAHTAAGLETVLKTLRPHTQNRLTVLFGIGGNGRDERANQGAIADQLADQIYITDDNPRDDDPARLRQLILDHIQNKNKITEIPDRKTAIETAIKESKTNDIILIAGKGHETYQEIKGIKHPFDDKEIALSS